MKSASRARGFYKKVPAFFAPPKKQFKKRQARYRVAVGFSQIDNGKATMIAPQNFNTFALTLPEKAIFARLGFNRQLTQISGAQRDKIQRAMTEAFALCEPRGRFLVAAITAITEAEITLSNGAVFVSAQLAKNLRGMTRAAIFSATIGAAITDAAAQKIADGDGADGLIFDATGSETVELAAEQIDEFLCRNYRAVGRVRFRFSPGYGDWPLAAQTQIDALLDLSAIGVKLADNFHLSPEKTITAVHGLP